MGVYLYLGALIVRTMFGKPAEGDEVEGYIRNLETQNETP